MRKRILSFIFVLSILVFGIYYSASRSSIVQTDIVKIDISKLNGNLLNWVNENKSEGVYIGRIPQNRKKERYYVYLNYKKAINLSVSSDRNVGLAINWEIGRRSSGETKLFEISTKNKRPDYIIFGGKKMDTLSISIIKE